MTNPYADPEKNLDHWIRVHDIVERRGRGESAQEIARALGVESTLVYRAVARAAERMRESVTGLVAERFMTQDAMLAEAIDVCQKRIVAAAAAGHFDRDAVTGLVKLMDRQSRLLDLDRAKRGEKGAGSPGALNSWLEKLSDAELMDYCKREGITLPDKFALA